MAKRGAVELGEWGRGRRPEEAKIVVNVTSYQRVQSFQPDHQSAGCCKTHLVADNCVRRRFLANSLGGCQKIN